MTSEEERHADETAQHWLDMPEQCREDAWFLFKSLLHHFHECPEPAAAWAKAYAIGLPVLDSEQDVDAPEIKQAFMLTLERGPDPPGLLTADGS